MLEWVIKNWCDGSEKLLTEYMSWFLVNCIVCQLPLLSMWINAADSTNIISSFLSYVFTFMISSYYTLMSLKSKSFKDGWNNVLGWSAVIYLVMIFGIMSVYPEIKNPIVKSILVGSPIISYASLLLISTILSWKLCVPYLVEKSKEEAEKEKSIAEYTKADLMKPKDLKESLEKDNEDEE